MYLVQLLYILFVVGPLVVCEKGDADNAVVVSETIDNDDTPEFVATHEWQTIIDGQSIPKGLHVRMNLQTGIKEAKLMDEDGSREVTSTAETVDEHQNRLLQLSPDELKAALKKLKDDGGPDVEADAKLRAKFKPYSELKDDFAKMNMAIKTDSEIVTSLIGALNDSLISGDKSAISTTATLLEDLEYYLHQYDNGVLLADLGGLNTLMRILNSTTKETRPLAAACLGAAAHNNPKVQIRIVDSGYFGPLLRLLANEADVLLKRRLLFAISSVLRHFPYAQQKFVSEGGVEVLSKQLHHDGTERALVRIVTLIDDLLVEQDLMKKRSLEVDPLTDQEQMRLAQYSAVHLHEQLRSLRWCLSVADLLPRVAADDTRDKLIRALRTLFETGLCDEPSVLKLQSSLRAIRSHYNALVAAAQSADQQLLNSEDTSEWKSREEHIGEGGGSTEFHKEILAALDQLMAISTAEHATHSEL